MTTLLSIIGAFFFALMVIGWIIEKTAVLIALARSQVIKAWNKSIGKIAPKWKHVQDSTNVPHSIELTSEDIAQADQQQKQLEQLRSPEVPLGREAKLRHIIGLPNNNEKGRAFELWCRDLYIALGYDAQTTGQMFRLGTLERIQGYDQGVDLILINPKDSFRIAVQCKCYSSSVSNRAVQEVLAGRTLYKCDKAVVITTSSFSSAAEQLAKANDIELINKWRLEEMIAEAEKRQKEAA